MFNFSAYLSISELFLKPKARKRIGSRKLASSALSMSSFWAGRETIFKDDSPWARTILCSHLKPPNQHLAPTAEIACMAFVENETEAFICSHQGRNPKRPFRSCKDPPRSTRPRETEDDADYQAENRVWRCQWCGQKTLGVCCRYRLERMKLGCDWLQRPASTVFTASLRAEGRMMC